MGSTSVLEVPDELLRRGLARSDRADDFRFRGLVAVAFLTCVISFTLVDRGRRIVHVNVLPTV